ncbi:MAG TPA: hypothetical protein VL022_10005 [Moheibacter sp.]|nr:hypothetical protein [Moheibacter sp.]
MKKLFLAFILMHGLVYSQVGIQTNDPKTTLDINGDIQLRNDLKVGGTDVQAGNSGVFGQLSVSGGKDKAVIWKDSKVPFLEEGQYQLVNSYSQIDNKGLSFPTGAGDGIATNKMNDPLSTNWLVLDDLTTEITINDPDNKISLVFQAGVELSKVSSNNQNVRYICGAFFNDQLKAMRPNQIDAINGKEKNQSLISLSYTVLNIAPGDHLVKVACRKISSTNNALRLGIGRSSEGAGNALTNNFTMQSVLKIDIIEKVTFELESN